MRTNSKPDYRSAIVPTAPSSSNTITRTRSESVSTNAGGSRQKALALFVHGFLGSKGSWHDLLKRLCKDHRITESFHLKLYGYPTRLFNFNPLRRIPKIAFVAHSLQAELESRFAGYPEVTLIGHSQGGLVIQSYLVRMLRNGKGEDLRRIRQVILIATPNLGSLFLSSLRKLFLPFNPQERCLRVLNDETSEIREEITKRVVGATSRKPHEWPISVLCFYGMEDGLVSRASAQGPFDDAKPLVGDHTNILRPADQNYPLYSALAGVLLKPSGHRNIHEIELYETSVTVEPLLGNRPYIALRGGRAREIHTDNFARVIKSVTFSTANNCVRPFLLDYRTHNPYGYVEVHDRDTSAQNEASEREIKRYEDSGTDFVFRFTPRAGESYSLKVGVYGGFNKGHRRVDFNLGDDFYCKKYRFTLDLTAYLASGWETVPGPQLSLSERDIKDDVGPPIPPVRYEPKGIWEWELDNIQRGVVHVVWDARHPS